jgi:hypothetical protein
MTYPCTNPIIEAIRGAPGYFSDWILPPEELSELRALVCDHFVARLTACDPTVGALAAVTPMTAYHTYADRIDHATYWSKRNRILPAVAVVRLRELSFFRKLEAIFGPVQISNESGIEEEEIYWRIVRPCERTDVGDVHADAWYWELGNDVTPPSKTRVKIWIGLHMEPDKSGLFVYPGSHRDGAYAYAAAERHGLIKPVFSTPLDPARRIDITAPDGRCVLFHDRLLHGGIPNAGRQTRVSIECTLFVDSANLT